MKTYRRHLHLYYIDNDDKNSSSIKTIPATALLDESGAREARRAPEAPAQVSISTILPQLNHYPDFTFNIYSSSMTGVFFRNNFSPMALQNKIFWL